jgi:hypothetical protein
MQSRCVKWLTPSCKAFGALFSRQPHGCGVPRRTASFCFFDKILKPLEPALGSSATGRWNQRRTKAECEDPSSPSLRPRECRRTKPKWALTPHRTGRRSAATAREKTPWQRRSRMTTERIMRAEIIRPRLDPLLHPNWIRRNAYATHGLCACGSTLGEVLNHRHARAGRQPNELIELDSRFRRE